MVKVTVELVRKRAEHHDMQLAPLREISLHQESIEKMEYIQDWCPKLQILLLQSNLISKIENFNKLKELEYLNLAINNIEKIENLERCEALQKLDLILNFIGELTSINNLENNYNLRLLYMNGNPCTDYDGYREYVISVLPQLEFLDNVKIKRSERIIALQNFPQVEKSIMKQQANYALKRTEQKNRLQREMIEKMNSDDCLDDEERCKRFWNEKSEHSPEVRNEMDRQTHLRRNPNKKEEVKKKERPLFTPDGRPYNINQPKLQFMFKDDNPQEYILEVEIYKYLDTSLMDVDVQPTYVRVTIKGKIFQLCLPEEINVTESTAKRSQTTGHLRITMPRLNQIISKSCISKNIQARIDKNLLDTPNVLNNNQNRREYLEIGPAHNIFNLNKLTRINSTNIPQTQSYFPREKLPSSDFIDNPEVPGLI